MARHDDDHGRHHHHVKHDPVLHDDYGPEYVVHHQHRPIDNINLVTPGHVRGPNLDPCADDDCPHRIHDDDRSPGSDIDYDNDPPIYDYLDTPDFQHHPARYDKYLRPTD